MVVFENPKKVHTKFKLVVGRFRHFYQLPAFEYWRFAIKALFFIKIYSLISLWKTLWRVSYTFLPPDLTDVMFRWEIKWFIFKKKKKKHSTPVLRMVPRRLFLIKKRFAFSYSQIQNQSKNKNNSRYKSQQVHVHFTRQRFEIFHGWNSHTQIGSAITKNQKTNPEFASNSRSLDCICRRAVLAPSLKLWLCIDS